MAITFPTQRRLQQKFVTCNGIPVWHCSSQEKAERYATDAEHRASLIVVKLHDR
jgi:hypothetical protein